ncbi:MAG: SocA family protein [Planctomycetes bacterium]|nr:SocA family protein [Planctomycetota bacterium]
METSRPRSRHGAPEDRTRQVVAYFIERLSGSIGRTRLAKLVYMADLEARRYLGHPISTLRYRVDHFGPFDARIFKELDALKARGEVFEDRIQTSEGAPWYKYRARTARAHAFTRGEEAILTHVLTRYGEKDLRDFLDDVIYATTPFVRVRRKPRGTPLPMESVDNEAKRRLGGIDLERVLLAEEEARAGKTIRLEEVRRELLGPDTAERPRGTEKLGT